MLDFTTDIHASSGCKRKTTKFANQVKKTGRPVVAANLSPDTVLTEVSGGVKEKAGD